MAQLPNTSESKQSSEIEQLKQEYETIMSALQAEKRESEALMAQLDADRVKRWQAAYLITDKDQRMVFLKLCQLNTWITNGNKHIRFCDDSGKVWMRDICDYSGNVAFMPKQKQSSKTPEAKEVSNFIYEMHSQWLHEYFVQWDEANSHKLKYQKLGTKTEQK